MVIKVINGYNQRIDLRFTESDTYPNFASFLHFRKRGITLIGFVSIVKWAIDQLPYMVIQACTVGINCQRLYSPLYLPAHPFVPPLRCV